MKRRTIALTLAGCLAGMWSAADTLHLSNGAALNGVVTKNGDGSYTLTVEGRKSLYRASEVVEHEKNSLTGSEYREEARRAAEEAERAARESTGLTAEQRAQVNRIVQEFNSSDRSKILKSIAELVAFGRTVEITEYLESLLPSLTPATYPHALEAFCTLAPGVPARRALAAAAEHPSKEIRAAAVRLMGASGDKETATLVARGLVDPTYEVRVSAAAALGQLNCKEATPALIDSLEGNRAVVQQTVLRSLVSIWSQSGDAPTNGDVASWREFWSTKKSGVGVHTKLESLKPLVDPDTEFVAG